MKSFAPRFFSLVLAALVSAPLFTPALRAQDSAHYRGSPLGSKVRIDGSANIHDWKMEGTIIGGSFELPTGIELDSTKAGVTGLAGDQLAAKARVQIPVTSVQSGTEGMDSVMQQAMDAENHPEIIFQLTSLTLKGTHAADSPFEFEAKGDLSLHGVTNAVTFPIKIENADKKKLKISGTVPLKMTSFKVTPPTKAGLFVTRDDVKITFEWLLNRREKPAAK